jgi:tetratricopeptide (TPR) repeat protein
MQTKRPTATAVPDITTVLKAARDRMAAGDLASARKTIVNVLKLAPGSVDGWNGLGHVCRLEGDHLAAVDAFDRSLRLKPGQPPILAARAQALADMGRVTDAAKAYDTLIAMFPREVKPRADKAHVLQQAGDFEAAEAEFRRALELAPDDGELYRVFLRSKKLKADDPLVAAMERAWAKDTLSVRSRAHLGFALAKAMEDSGQHDRVFRYLKPANEAMRRLHPFDMADRERRLDALLEAFRGHDYSRHPAAEPGDFGPIFVSGLPRSGTTLVEQIVSAHPQVEGGGEMAILFRQCTDMLARPDGSYRPLGTLSPEDLSRLAAAYRTGARKALKFDRRFTDKSIQTDMVAGLVRMAIPGARIIEVARDPRDILFSIYKNVFAPGKHLYAYDLRDLARYWKIHRRFIEFWDEAIPGIFHHVRYEGLVADLDGQARAMVAAAALPWDDACLHYDRNTRQVKTLSTHQVRQPIYDSSVGAWRRFEADLSELLDELGDVG